MLCAKIFRNTSLLTLLLFVGSCGDSGQLSDGSSELSDPRESQAATGRWYSQNQVDDGRQVFMDNCALCHGANAQGTVANWQRRLDDGSLPPPPLNGSAHAWHHPRSVLLQVINEGGIPLGGNMPAFREILEEAEKLAAIAYFQSFWEDEIYQQWGQMGGIN